MKHKLGWGPGNPLWEWQNQRYRKKAMTAYRKANKSEKRHISRSVPMAKTKWRTRFVHRVRRRASKMTIPIAPVLGMVPLLARGATEAMKGNAEWYKYLLNDSIAYDFDSRTFNMQRAITNFTPLVAGLLIHKFVGGSPLNFNRTLAKAKVPLIRI
jgi:hypothetical protein